MGEQNNKIKGEITLTQLEFDKENEVEQVQFGSKLELEDPKEPEVAVLPVETDEEGQLELFDEPKETSKAKEKKPAASAPKKAAPEQKVTNEFMIYYAGNQIPVLQDEMTLEEVRSFLESDFPELSKERTEMTVNMEKKEVVPVVKGAKKG